jgi:hypothetical protein
MQIAYPEIQYPLPCILNNSNLPKPFFFCFFLFYFLTLIELETHICFISKLFMNCIVFTQNISCKQQIFAFTGVKYVALSKLAEMHFKWKGECYGVFRG